MSFKLKYVSSSPWASDVSSEKRGKCLIYLKAREWGIPESDDFLRPSSYWEKNLHENLSASFPA